MDSRSRSDARTPAESDSPISTGASETEPSVLFDNLDELLRRLPAESPYILVTGGLGFIGSHTTLELLKANYNVIVIDNLSNAFEGVLDHIRFLAHMFHKQNGTQMPSLHLHAYDYRDTTALRPLLEEHQIPTRWGAPKSKIAGVIHFAAFKAVEESIRQPLKYYANNVSGLVDFATTLGDFGIKTFIFSSSATVYGTLASSNLPLKEEKRSSVCTKRKYTPITLGLNTLSSMGALELPTHTGARNGSVRPSLQTLPLQIPSGPLLHCDTSILLAVILLVFWERTRDRHPQISCQWSSG
ncbi:uncharacterized protein N7459_000636 [Penicillium hispanicum]|uniref:uncharacterized protein n=1 Tax=Penicillium hispanicum TaxID=1080232 RepID=UPI00253FB39F|nr:uncharacterized protein N7459_000636 [Penicillium hispanicum]KAJ5594428.1 hypothetical protein N7459_000636 [Penicillium hispanicum]